MKKYILGLLLLFYMIPLLIMWLYLRFICIITSFSIKLLFRNNLSNKINEFYLDLPRKYGKLLDKCEI